MTEYLPFPDTVPLGEAWCLYEVRCKQSPNTVRVRYEALDWIIDDAKHMSMNVIEGDTMCLPGEYWLSREENNGH